MEIYRPGLKNIVDIMSGELDRATEARDVDAILPSLGFLLALPAN